MNHMAENSQCDLNQYPDAAPGDVKCTCDEDAPVEPATGPPRAMPVRQIGTGEIRMVDGPQHPHFGTGPHVVTLTGRAATSHAELREAGRELRAAQDLYRKAEARWKQALDAHMQELQ